MSRTVDPAQARELIERVGHTVVAESEAGLIIRNWQTPGDRGTYAVNFDPREDVPLDFLIDLLVDEAGISRALISSELEQMGL